MAEIVFILIIVYAVYIFRTSVTGNQRKKEDVTAAIPQVTVEVIADKKEEKKVATEKKAKVKKTPVAKKSQPAKSKISTKLPAGSLRNPESGEVAKIASQYRMTKRWIKEALVTEGLLEKIYKASEIDDAAKLKINKALTKLAKMDKYQ